MFYFFDKFLSDKIFYCALDSVVAQFYCVVLHSLDHLKVKVLPPKCLYQISLQVLSRLCNRKEIIELTMVMYDRQLLRFLI